MGDLTPVFSIVQRRSREASQRTMFRVEEGEGEGVADVAEVGGGGREGGKSLATQRSP